MIKKCWLLLVFAFAPAKSMVASEFRVLRCKPTIAQAIKTNLDEAKVSTDQFDKTYQRLVDSKDITEISRVSEPSENAPKDLSNIKPTKDWQVWLQAKPSGSGNGTGYGAQLQMVAPGEGKSALHFDAAANRTAVSNQWCVLCEFSWNGDRILWLGRAPDAPDDGGKSKDRLLEGMVFKIKTADAAILAGKSPAEIAEICMRYGMNEDTEVFRTWETIGGQSAISKAGPKGVGIQASDAKNRVELSAAFQCVESPDRKLVDCSGTVLLMRDGARAELQPARTIPKNEWRLISTAELEGGESEALILKISAGETKPSEIDPIRPLPEKGNSTRSYPVQPSAMRVLQKKFPGPANRQPKKLFSDAGMPDGNWKIFYNSTGPSFMVSGEQAAHEAFLKIIGELLWKD